MVTSFELVAQQDEYIRSFMMSIVRSLVDELEPVSIEVVSSEIFLTLKVRASRTVIATLVGPKGQMARAIRTLLAGTSAKLGRRYAIELVDGPS